MKGCNNFLRQRIKNKELLVFGSIMDARSGSVVEAYHEAGYDVFLIDREHTALNSETILEHIRLARALEFPCMVRVADSSYHELNRTLDQAPDGIFVPRIRNRKEVEAIMRMVKYPPKGDRGLGGSTCPIGKYAGWSSITDQIEYVNRDLVIGIQIETAEALLDLDGILSVPGVDIAVVGGDDLTIRMGIPGQTNNPAYFNAVLQVIEKCRKYDILPGIACGDAETAGFWIQRGMRVLWYASEIYLLWKAIAEHRKRLEDVLQKMKGELLSG